MRQLIHFSPRQSRFVRIVIGGLVSAAVAIGLTISFITPIADNAVKATVVAGTITLLGAIFTAVYNEISSYYKDRTANADQKWKLIYPLITKHYHPWINAAKSLHGILERTSKDANLSEASQILVMFLVTLFFGLRMRFLKDAGGVILLSTPDEEKKVEKAYRQIQEAFRWDGESTEQSISYLQNLFVRNDRPDSPYLITTLAENLVNTDELRAMRKTLSGWLTLDNRKALQDAIKGFVEEFEEGINKLYSAWES